MVQHQKIRKWFEVVVTLCSIHLLRGHKPAQRSLSGTEEHEHQSDQPPRHVICFLIYSL